MENYIHQNAFQISQFKSKKELWYEITEERTINQKKKKKLEIY